jgi:hypothetical protein
MKWWIELAVRLYPTAWRERYGPEFGALLEDVEPGWRELLDVLGGAVTMRMTFAGLYWKLGVAFAALGAVLSVVGPLAPRTPYSSTALLRVSANGPDALDLGPIVAVEQEVLSRASLSGLIQKPGLNLYPSDRQREPLEDVINSMRTRDLKVDIVSRDSRSAVLSISYRYPEQAKAQAVVRNVVARFNNAFEWQHDVNSHMRGATPILQTLEMVEAPTSPAPVEQDRLRTIFAGLVGGLTLGVFVAFFAGQPKRATIVSSVGLAGCIAGVACSFLMTPRYVSSAVMRIVPFDHLSGTLEGRHWLEDLARQVGGPAALKTHLSKDGTALELEMTDRDPSKAQWELDKIRRRLIETGRADIQGTDRPGSLLNSGIVEMVDSASLPVRPAFPNRLVVGMMMGFLTALAAGFLTRKPRRQLPPGLPLDTGAAALGKAANLIERRHGGVAGESGEKGTMGPSQFDGLFGLFASK